LTKHWYKNRKVNKEEERQRIVEAAAIIIREDIRSQINDTSSFPAPNEFLTNVDSVIPKTLSLFLNSVILSNKKGDRTHVSKKCTSIAHAIMSVTRPRSFRSTIQMSVGIYSHRKFESRYLINILSRLGLCSTYHDIIKFETSSFIYPQTRVLENSFSQFVFDNADFNSCTINGLNTTHIMDGICCATPATSVIPDEPLIIVKTLPSAKDISKYGQVPIYYYEKGIESGLKNIEIRFLNQFTTFQRTTQHLQPIDVLWACGKYLKINNLSGWNGYMENICQLSPIDYSLSQIIFLPFVDLPAHSYDAISTVLHFAVTKSNESNQKTTFVTFDLPLYMKAKDIVHTHGKELSNVIVRLGGFHLLMSFLGCIGYLMTNSGLQEILDTICAPNSVEKLLTGHAYSRAVRAHSLTHLALSKLIFERIKLTEDERVKANEYFSVYFEQPTSMEVVNQDPNFNLMTNKFITEINSIKNLGPTAELWIQYFEMVTLMKKFIQAERLGDWYLHLSCCREMLPYFQASGHIPYAKATYLYLQEMLTLEQKMNADEYSKFVTKGYSSLLSAAQIKLGLVYGLT